jgi:hypothetical protein
LYKATSTTIRCQETLRAWACFAIDCWLSGGVRYVAAARDAGYRGRAVSPLLADGFRHHAYSIPIPMRASPLPICDKNRMR